MAAKFRTFHFISPASLEKTLPWVTVLLESFLASGGCCNLWSSLAYSCSPPIYASVITWPTSLLMCLQISLSLQRHQPLDFGPILTQYDPILTSPYFQIISHSQVPWGLDFNKSFWQTIQPTTVTFQDILRLTFYSCVFLDLLFSFFKTSP